jgi:adenylate cyclase
VVLAAYNHFLSAHDGRGLDNVSRHNALAGDRLASTADWLVCEGRLEPKPEAFVEQLMAHVVAAGLPIWRLYIGLQLNHPQLQAMGFVWRRGEMVHALPGAHGIYFTPAYIGSPMQEAREQRRMVRYRLDEITDRHHLLLREVKADGGTDYCALPMRLSRDWPMPVVTFATDLAGGFSDLDLADLTRLVDMIGAITEMHTERSLGETVANTYLGRQVGQRVMSGAIRRGEGQQIKAVLWFSDLRDFTGMNERMEPAYLLELLNDYLQLIGDALAAHGGEILKFIGDGVMAYFPVGDSSFLPILTSAALGAARQVSDDIKVANEARASDGKVPLRFGIGLHVGTVTFGNIGTNDRLDFTVIGPAVNRAARLEGLTKVLNVSVCASADFNEVCPLPMRSLGTHRMRGVPKSVEVFTLLD